MASTSMQIMRTKPAVMEFSLYYPSIDSNTYHDIISQVMPYIQEIMCDNHIFLVDSKKSIGLCPPPDDNNNSNNNSGFNITDTNFGNIDNSVLMETPTLVTDESVGTIRWMKWRTLYYILQLGEPVVAMTEQMMMQVGPSFTTTTPEEGGGGTTTNAITDLQVVDVINNQLELGLQVSIMEGCLDERLQQNLPGARISLSGQELDTWSPHNPSIAGFPSSSTSFTLTDQMSRNENNIRGEPSTVAMALQRSHVLRYLGGLCMGLLFLNMVFLHIMGQRQRRFRRRTRLFHQRRGATQGVKLATEDDVTNMLQAGGGGSSSSRTPVGEESSRWSNHPTSRVLILA